MTIDEALSKIDELRDNSYSPELKIEWLSRLDRKIFRDIICTYQQSEPKVFNGYTPDTPRDTELLVKSPDDELYLFYLEQKIDYYDKDFDMYNASTIAFSDAYSDFVDNYNETHMPIRTRIKFF